VVIWPSRSKKSGIPALACFTRLQSTPSSDASTRSLTKPSWSRSPPFRKTPFTTTARPRSSVIAGCGVSAGTDQYVHGSPSNMSDAVSFATLAVTFQPPRGSGERGSPS
jgi:hypothetical protein